MHRLMHEETQDFGRTGFEAITSVLSDIQFRIAQLEASIRINQLPQLSSDGILLQQPDGEDLALTSTDLTGGTLTEDVTIASECIGFANLLHDKVSSRATSFAGSSAQSRASGGVRHLATQPTSPVDHTDSLGDLTAILDVNCSNAAQQPYARPHKRPVVEDEDVLSDHVDNSYRLALDAIRNKDFEDAKAYMEAAISAAEQRENIYNFPFENRSDYLEILASILTQKEEFREAEQQYYNLLEQAQGLRSNLKAECRLCFALAKLYRAENRLDPRTDKDDPLFIAWYDHAIHAFKLAKSLETTDIPLESPETHAIWNSHPTLRQAAEMVFEMYTCRGMPAHADTYRQRHLSRPESLSPSNIPKPTVPFPQMFVPYIFPPPSPPETDPIIPPTLSVTRGSSEWSAPGTSSHAGAPGIQEHIEKCQYEIVKWILHSPDHFIDVEQCNDRGQTLLLLAVTKRNIDIVRLLLNYHNKPNVKAKDKSGRSVLHYALRGQGGEDMVELLVDNGADVNACTPEGTPLHFAIINNKPRAVQTFAANNADLEARDGAGRTPMALAMKHKRDELVRSLVDAGAIFDRTMFTDAGSKQFIKQLEASKIIPHVQSSGADNAASRRESVGSTRTTFTTVFRIFGRSSEKSP